MSSTTRDPDPTTPARPSSKRGEPGQADPLFKTGATLAARYKIIEFIGHGGMGEVYEARDGELGERIALKTVRPHIAGDPSGLERFRREILLARKVTHPNVCRIFDLGYHEDVPFLTMEFLEGETLAALIERKQRFQLAEALPLLVQMAAAVDAAHAAGVVHRDFKPSNVM